MVLTLLTVETLKAKLFIVCKLIAVLIVGVLVPSDLLKNTLEPSTYTSNGNCVSASTSFDCRAPDVLVDIIAAFPSLGDGTIVLVVDLDIK